MLGSNVVLSTPVLVIARRKEAAPPKGATPAAQRSTLTARRQMEAVGSMEHADK